MDYMISGNLNTNFMFDKICITINYEINSYYHLDLINLYD